MSLNRSTSFHSVYRSASQWRIKPSRSRRMPKKGKVLPGQKREPSTDPSMHPRALFFHARESEKQPPSFRIRFVWTQSSVSFPFPLPCLPFPSLLPRLFHSFSEIGGGVTRTHAQGVKSIFFFQAHARNRAWVSQEQGKNA